MILFFHTDFHTIYLHSLLINPCSFSELAITAVSSAHLVIRPPDVVVSEVRFSCDSIYLLSIFLHQLPSKFTE